MDATRHFSDTALAQLQLNQAFIEAIYPEKNLNKARELHQAGASINAIDSKGNNTLLNLIQGLTAPHMKLTLERLGPEGLQKEKDLVDFLLRNKIAVNHPSSNGVTALHIAALRGIDWCMEMLLNAGADHTLQNINRHTPAYSLWVKHTDNSFTLKAKECLELLYARGDRFDPPDGIIPLLIIFAEHPTAFPFLAERKINFGWRNNVGEHAISVLARQGCWNAVIELARNGCPLGERDIFGKTLEEQAAGNGLDDVVRAICQIKGDRAIYKLNHPDKVVLPTRRMSAS